MFVLDTDHLGIVQRQSAPQHAALTHRMRQHSLEDFFVAIVSFHEQVNGWNTYIQRARADDRVVRGYAMFQAILADFTRMNILPFDSEAAKTFAGLRRVPLLALSSSAAATAIKSMRLPSDHGSVAWRDGVPLAPPVCCRYTVLPLTNPRPIRHPGRRSRGWATGGRVRSTEEWH